MNKSKTILIGMMFIFLIIGMNAVHSANFCWSSINCNGKSIPNGSIINSDYTTEKSIKEEMCEIEGINVDVYRQFEIEIIQGQFEGGVKSIRIFVDDQFIQNHDMVHFVLSKATSPTYVLCHEVQNSSGVTENPVRLGTRRFWTASYDQQWFKQNAGMAEYQGYENLKNWIENNIYNNSDKNSLHVTNEETKTQQENNDNRILLILFGILVCVLSVGIYILTYKKGYKIIGIGIWFSLSLFSLIILDDPYRLLSLIGIFFSIYLMIIWIKENAINIMKGKKDKI